MTTKILNMSTKQVSASNYTYDGFPQYVMQPAIRKETFEHACLVPAVGASISGAVNEAKIEFTDSNANKNGNIVDFVLESDVANAGDGIVTFYHPYLILDNIILEEDGIEIDRLKNQDQILMRVDAWTRDCLENSSKLFTEWQQMLNFNGTSIGGLVCTNGSTSYLRLSLLPLFPYLRNKWTRSFKNLKVKWQYAINNGTTAGVCRFCVSSTTTNNYPSLSLSNIKMRTIVNVQPDNRLVLYNPAQQKYWIRRVEDIKKIGAFNTAGTDYFRVNLKNDFSSGLQNVVGMYVYAQSPDNRAAYNSANSCVVSSLPETLCFKVKYNTDVMMDHSNASSNLIDRRRYALDVQLNNFSYPLNENMLTSGNYFNKYGLILLGYIDFTNIPIADNHESALSGISSDNNVEVEVYCGSTGVDADNTYLHVGLVYLECVDKSSGSVEVKRGKTVYA